MGIDGKGGVVDLRDSVDVQEALEEVIPSPTGKCRSILVGNLESRHSLNHYAGGGGGRILLYGVVLH